jgi:hypothetical protein
MSKKEDQSKMLKRSEHKRHCLQQITFYKLGNNLSIKKRKK